MASGLWLTQNTRGQIPAAELGLARGRFPPELDFTKTGLVIGGARSDRGTDFQTSSQGPSTSVESGIDIARAIRGGVDFLARLAGQAATVAPGLRPAAGLLLGVNQLTQAAIPAPQEPTAALSPGVGVVDSLGTPSPGGPDITGQSPDRYAPTQDKTGYNTGGLTVDLQAGTGSVRSVQGRTGFSFDTITLDGSPPADAAPGPQVSGPSPADAGLSAGLGGPGTGGQVAL